MFALLEMLSLINLKAFFFGDPPFTHHIFSAGPPFKAKFFHVAPPQIPPAPPTLEKMNGPLRS